MPSKNGFTVAKIFLLAAFFSLPQYAAENSSVEKIALEINGKSINNIGRAACKITDKNAKLIFSEKLKKLHDDFRVIRVTGDKTDINKASCPKTIADNKDNMAAIDDIENPVLAQKFLLSSGQCSKSGSQGTNLLCVYPDSSGNTEVVAEFRYSFDTTVATIDDITEKGAANGVISFTVKSSGPVSKIESCHVAEGAGNIEDLVGEERCPFKSLTHSPPKVRIDGLDNEVNYFLKVRPVDNSGNGGQWGSSFELKPVPVENFLSTYEGQGSELEFDCTSSNFSGLLMFLILLALLRGLRSKKSLNSWLPLIILACVWLPAKSSSAYLGQVNIGLLGSMYRPDLDSEKKSDGSKIFPSYKCHFRKDTSDTEGPVTPLIGVEVDVHLLDGYGSLQLGSGFGYALINGRGLAIKNGQPDCDNPLDDVKMSMHLYQIRPQLTYLMDFWKDYFPLFPYVRGSVIAQGYSFTSDFDGFSSTERKKNGFRFGYQAEAGLMLMLDFLEPGSLRSASGILEHVYLKGGLSYTKIDSFGTNGYQFSAKDIMGSDLPLMWNFGLVFELP